MTTVNATVTTVNNGHTADTVNNASTDNTVDTANSVHSGGNANSAHTAGSEHVERIAAHVHDNHDGYECLEGCAECGCAHGCSCGKYVPVDLLDTLGDVDSYKPEPTNTNNDTGRTHAAAWMTLKTMSMIDNARVIGLPRRLTHEVQVDIHGSSESVRDTLGDMVTSILSGFPYAGDDESIRLMLTMNGVWIIASKHRDVNTISSKNREASADVDERTGVTDDRYSALMLSIVYAVTRITGRDNIPFHTALMEWGDECINDDSDEHQREIVEQVNSIPAAFTTEELDTITEQLRREENWFEAYNTMAQDALNQMVSIALSMQPEA